MRFFVILAVTAAVAAYGPPRLSTGGDGGCGSGCGSTGGGSQVVTTHVSPCPGGVCGGSSVSGGVPSSGDYWWQGQDNPFAKPGGQPSPGSHTCSGSGCASGGTPCTGSGCPSSSLPAPGPGPAPGQNLLLPPMGICSANYICVHWQLCRGGLVIDDGTGAIDKQRKEIPPLVAATYTSCGGDMICCGLPDSRTQPGPGTPVHSFTPGTSPSLSPGTPAHPHTSIIPPKFSGPATPARQPTPVSPPKFSGPGTHALPHTPVSPPKFSGPGTSTRPHTSVSPPKPSVPATSAGLPTPFSPPKSSGPGVPASPHTPSSPSKLPGSATLSLPPKFSGSGTLPSPQTPVSPPKFSGSATPSSPSSQPSASSPSYGYPSPGVQQSAGPSPLPSTVNQARPVPPSQPLSTPVGLASPPSGQAGAMGSSMGMMGMMGMMPRSGTCSAGTYCVLAQQCNPYTGFIMRGNVQVMAVWPESPTVPLLPCFVPDGSITDGVCCQEAHPNAGGFD